MSDEKSQLQKDMELLANAGTASMPRNKVKTLAHTFTDVLHQLDPAFGREGTAETSMRVAKAWGFWTKGYDQDAADLLKTFEDGAEGYDQMVIQVDIPFYSHCEHHLAPFWGLATVGYIPKGKVVGLSKMNRLVDMFARRLQVQERLTQQVADAMWEHLEPAGVGVVLRARHMCVESRGIQHRGNSTTTTALHGVMKSQPDTRAEFMSRAVTDTVI